MTGFLTYAQNFEDLMLWRALHGVAEGFYVDVGAADPGTDSVTRAFYERGWRGINVEPSPDHFASLARVRPRDVNLRCVLGRQPGTANLYNLPGTGLSTIEREIAERHAAAGHQVETIDVPVRTLADVCGEFAPARVHFLKIDVEGAEQDVLGGADFTAYRPWIVLVEATEPGSQVENWEAWDPLLQRADYRFVWFDGLNRFYLAAEQDAALRHAFRTPPNVFDQWMRPGEGAALVAEADVARAEARSSRAAADAARTEARALQSALAAAEQETRAARAEVGRFAGAQQALDRAEAMLAAVEASTSWRLTAPLRALSQGLRRLGGNSGRRQPPRPGRRRALSATRSRVPTTGCSAATPPIAALPRWRAPSVSAVRRSRPQNPPGDRRSSRTI